jgi:nucleoside-diphosphate-sugar epimerase
MQVLILGCGYVGTGFGEAMVRRGARVYGTCRTSPRAEVLRAASIMPILFDGVPTGEIREIAAASDVILASIPPSDTGDASFLALEKVLRARSETWIGYLSTTGIYGDRQGGWAFEDDVPTPESREALRRADAERAWQSLPSAAHIFRLPGIYGPGRSALDQVRSGSARRIDRTGQVFSRAHREDIVTALLASYARPNPGRSYNICDDKPCASGDVIVEASRLLG